MSTEIYEFLAGIPVFSELADADLQQLALQAQTVQLSADTVLETQGRSELNCIYVLQSGRFELFYSRENKKISTGFLGPGDIFGGISILVNSSIALRTVVVLETADCVTLSSEIFLQMCDRCKAFKDFFLETYKRYMEDQTFVNVVEASKALSFLSEIAPFSFLSETQLSEIAMEIVSVRYPENTVICVQNSTEMEDIHIVRKGAAKQYYEDDSGIRTERLMAEGDIFGGISMLVNNGVAIRTLKTTEHTDFYLLSRPTFLRLCDSNSNFTEFFTDTFGRRMLDKSYAAIFTKAVTPRAESMQLLNQPVASIYQRSLVSCDQDLSIQGAAVLMSQHKCSSILLQDRSGTYTGIITDNDLRRKVVATGYDIQQSAMSIMSSPLRTIPAHALIFEALLLMMQDNVKHLAVTDAEKRVIGILTNREMLVAQGQSPLFLMREIATTTNLPDLFHKQRQLPPMIRALFQIGAQANNITRIITTIADSILTRLMDFAISETGPPPVRFAFMLMGSEGRREQTLKTDQDNAIVFENVPDSEEKAVQAWFLELGNRICSLLNQAGFAFCKGDVMARNPKWCQPLKVWQQNFSAWIHAADPEHLLHASIFFDFRHGYGDVPLVNDLRSYLMRSLSGWPGFFRHLTENALHFKPPIGFFRNFIVESKGEHRNKFDIKSAMMPIVDYARIHALHKQIIETNTLERLHQLYRATAISWQDYNEMEQAYNFLMQLRFVRQISAIMDENTAPDNYINPKRLSRIEQTILKEIFVRLEKVQGKLGFDFTGTV